MRSNGKLAGGRIVDVGLCEVTARPANKLRRFIRDWWPYVQSQKPRFELIVTPLGIGSSSQRFLYTLQYSNGNRHPPHELSASQLERGKRRHYKLVAIPVIVTGDTYLVVADRDVLQNNRNIPHYKIVYAFTTISKTAMIGILIALIGTLIGIIANIVW